ncbi:MAG: hypothetical protein ACTTJ7_09075 [Treponema sp.]
MSVLQNFFRWIKGIQIYALVGASGTGKSFRARMVAQKYRIDLIIDDGLLIRGDKILAGHSAKKEKTFLAAVKTAVFDDPVHCKEAVKALQRISTKKILILGTSEKMVKKIATRLHIPAPQRIIRIEDIATQEEIEAARRSRCVEGKHIIPVPSSEVQRNYPQIFYDNIRLLFHDLKKGRLKEEEKLFEKSLVRPAFSVTDTITVADEALQRMLVTNLAQYDAVIAIKQATIVHKDSGYYITMMIDIPFNTELTVYIEKLKDFLVKHVEKESGIFIEEIYIIINQVIIQHQDSAKTPTRLGVVSKKASAIVRLQRFLSLIHRSF